MALQNLKCPSCGANLEIDTNNNVGICPYCRSKIMLSEKVDVKVTIDNKNENKIKMAYQYMQEANYEKAEKILKDILNDDITNDEAWWGRYLCETYYAKYYGYTDKYGNSGNQVKARMIQNNLQYAYRAIENAPFERKEKYQQLILEDEKFLKQYR